VTAAVAAAIPFGAQAAFELTPQFFLLDLSAVAREIALLPIQRILTPRELPNLLERIFLLVLLALFGRRRRLVVRLVALTQFLIEQRREIRIRPVHATAATGLLLTCHLPAAVFRIRFQQLIERFHLVRERAGGAHLIEFDNRAAHRFDGLADWIVAWRDAAGRSPPAGRTRELCPRGFGALLQIRLHSRDRAHVFGRLRVAYPARAGVELPRRDDDFLLRLDQPLQPAVAAAGAAHHRLALRGNELLFERLHFEEEDVAARFGRSPAARHVAGACEVGYEVSRLNAEVLHEHRVEAVRGQSAFRSPERDHLLLAAGTLKYEIERRDAVVVVSARLDLHFLERRHLFVARRPQDAHIRRTIVERADEVLRLSGIFQTVDVGQRHAIGTVVFDRQLAMERTVVADEIDRVAAVERQCPMRDGLVRGDGQLYFRAGGSIDITAVFIEARFETEPAREVVADVNPFDTWRMNDRDGVVVGSRSSDRHVIAERSGHMIDRGSETALPIRGGLHRQLARIVADDHRQSRCESALESRHLRADDDLTVATDFRRPGLNVNGDTRGKDIRCRKIGGA
jgi:hypothetical protein